MQVEGSYCHHYCLRRAPFKSRTVLDPTSMVVKENPRHWFKSGTLEQRGPPASDCLVPGTARGNLRDGLTRQFVTLREV